jgi:hypothetical protein
LRRMEPAREIQISDYVGDLMFHFQIWSEERILTKAFGDEYSSYQKTVRRYMPEDSFEVTRYRVMAIDLI